jgi:hypothetical protein
MTPSDLATIIATGERRIAERRRIGYGDEASPVALEFHRLRQEIDRLVQENRSLRARVHPSPAPPLSIPPHGEGVRTGGDGVGESVGGA